VSDFPDNSERNNRKRKSFPNENKNVWKIEELNVKESKNILLFDHCRVVDSLMFDFSRCFAVLSVCRFPV